MSGRSQSSLLQEKNMQVVGHIRDYKYTSSHPKGRSRATMVPVSRSADAGVRFILPADMDGPSVRTGAALHYYDDGCFRRDGNLVTEPDEVWRLDVAWAPPRSGILQAG